MTPPELIGLGLQEVDLGTRQLITPHSRLHPYDGSFSSGQNASVASLSNSA